MSSILEEVKGVTAGQDNLAFEKSEDMAYGMNVLDQAELPNLGGMFSKENNNMRLDIIIRPIVNFWVVVIGGIGPYFRVTSNIL